MASKEPPNLPPIIDPGAPEFFVDRLVCFRSADGLACFALAAEEPTLERVMNVTASQTTIRKVKVRLLMPTGALIVLHRQFGYALEPARAAPRIC